MLLLQVTSPLELNLLVEKDYFKLLVGAVMDILQIQAQDIVWILQSMLLVACGANLQALFWCCPPPTAWQVWSATNSHTFIPSSNYPICAGC